MQSRAFVGIPLLTALSWILANMHWINHSTLHGNRQHAETYDRLYTHSCLASLQEINFKWLLSLFSSSGFSRLSPPASAPPELSESDWLAASFGTVGRRLVYITLFIIYNLPSLAIAPGEVPSVVGIINSPCHSSASRIGCNSP